MNRFGKFVVQELMLNMADNATTFDTNAFGAPIPPYSDSNQIKEFTLHQCTMTDDWQKFYPPS